MEDLHSAAEALQKKKEAAALQRAAQLNHLSDVDACEHQLLAQLLSLLRGTTTRVENLETSLAATASELADERRQRQADVLRLEGQVNQLQSSLAALETNHVNALSQLQTQIISVTQRFEESEDARHRKEVEAARERNEAAERVRLIEEAEQRTLVQIHRCPTATGAPHNGVILPKDNAAHRSPYNDMGSPVVVARSSSLTVNGEMVWFRFPTDIPWNNKQECEELDASNIVVVPDHVQWFEVTPPPSEKMVPTSRVTATLLLFDGSACDVSLRGGSGERNNMGGELTTTLPAAAAGPSCKIVRNGFVVLIRMSNGRCITRDLTSGHFFSRQSGLQLTNGEATAGADRSWQSNAAEVTVEFEVAQQGKWSLDVKTFPNSRFEDLPFTSTLNSLSTIIIVNESLNAPVVLLAPGPLVITTIPHRISNNVDALSLPGIPGIPCAVRCAQLQGRELLIASAILRQCPLNCEVCFRHALLEPVVTDITIALPLPTGVEALISCRGESAPFAVGAALIMCQFDDRRELVIGELRSTLMVRAEEKCTLRLKVDGARRTFSVSFVEKGIRLVDLPFDSMSTFAGLYRLLIVSRNFM